MVFIRVVRFDHVQWFCIGSALLGVYLTIQGYVSTDFAASKILLWSPILLVIDAGAMLQVFFLVVEGVSVKVGERTILMEPGDAPEGVTLPQSEPLATSVPRRFESIRRRLVLSGRKYSEAAVASEHGSTDEKDNIPSPWPAWLAAGMSAILFGMIVVLQFLGLHAVFSKGGLRDEPQTTWCSPMFQPFGVAVLDGDCNVYAIAKRSAQGIGCIELAGQWQREWFWISAIGTIVCLIAELVDMILLALVNGKSKIGGAVKLKRPWATMILGLAALCLTLFFGVEYSNTLPPGITQHVTVVAEVRSLMAFNGNLVTTGLRGAIIGWVSSLPVFDVIRLILVQSDGLFQSWGKAYLGS